MDNETREMFELIVNKLDKVDSRLDKVDSRLDGIDSRLDGIDSRLDGMDSRFDAIESRLDVMDSRQDEIFRVVKAIEHANQVNKAEIDSVKVRTDYLEGTFSQIGNVITSQKAVNQD